MAKIKLTPEEVRARNAAKMRAWSASPAGRAYAERVKEERAARAKARREADPDVTKQKERLYREAYYATERGRRLTLDRHEKWRKENPKAYAEARSRYYATEKGRLYKWSNSASQRCRKATALRADGRIISKVGGNVTAQQLRDLWEKQDGKCALTGRPLLMLNGKSALDSPSVDRINPLGKYEIDNIRLVTLQANAAKLYGTDEDLHAFCQAVLAHRDKLKE